MIAISRVLAIPDPAPDYSWVSANWAWLLLVFLICAAVVTGFVVFFSNRGRRKAREEWEQSHPGQSWDALERRPRGGTR